MYAQIDMAWWAMLDNSWQKVFTKAVGFECDSSNFFEEIVTLKNIDCSRSIILSLEPLRGLTNLKELNCWGNQIRSLEPLRGLINLQTLNCATNTIDSLEPLRGLMSLQTLDCSANKITSLAPLYGLTNLKVLHCWDNQIKRKEIDTLKEFLPDCKINPYGHNA